MLDCIKSLLSVLSKSHARLCLVGFTHPGFYRVLDWAQLKAACHFCSTINKTITKNNLFIFFNYKGLVKKNDEVKQSTDKILRKRLICK